MISVLRRWFDRYFYDEEAILLVILLGLSFLVIWTMGSTLGPVFVAIIIAFLMQGLVLWMKQKGMPHLVSVSVAFLLLMSCLIAALIFIVPAVWQQLEAFVQKFPEMISNWRAQLQLLPEKYPNYVTAEQIDQLFSAINPKTLSGFGQSILSFSLANLPALFAILLYLVLVPVLVFFFLKDGKGLLGWMGTFLPDERPLLDKVWREMNLQIANYVRGKVAEILIVASASYISFVILGLDYAMLLAIAVGLSVVIPYIGAVVVTVPVMLIGLFQWGWTDDLLYLAIVYLVIQALDGNVLVPLLFSEAVNLHPVSIILSVLIFGGIWGFWGVFFAIPLATLVKAVFNAWPARGDLEISKN